MRQLALGFGVLVLCAASRADAHRLDEYLQQTLIEVEPNRIVLHVDLTPGVAVAADVIPAIDKNHDGALSASEQAAYTEQVRRDLSLHLNDAAMPLRAIETHYPTVATMTGGTGTIALMFEAALSPEVRSGTLHFANHHAAASAAYLVNCLMPHDPETHVLSQSRSRDQASYQVGISFGTKADPPSGVRAAVWIALSLAGVLSAWWGLRPSPTRGASRA
jgi:aspartate-semialdehyde dehydrogenase